MDFYLCCCNDSKRNDDNGDLNGTERSCDGGNNELYVIHMLEDHVHASLSCGYHDSV